jgi:hypothetical protein
VQSIICSACNYEYDTPAVSSAGPVCPRCGEHARAGAERVPATPGADVYVTAAFLGTALGLLAAGILILSRGHW